MFLEKPLYDPWGAVQITARSTLATRYCVQVEGIAVKVTNHLGDEEMKVFSVE